MAFLERQVLHGKWVEVDGLLGTEYIEAGLVGQVDEYHGTQPVALPARLQQFCENTTAWSIHVVEGYGARMAAFGYLDSTPWSFFTSRQEAEAYLDGLEELHDQAGSDEADE